MKPRLDNQSQAEPKERQSDSTDNRAVESALNLGGANSREGSATELPAIPGYTILGKLGQGGMGQVYKALQERLDRTVALKVVRQDRISQDKEAIKRFQREARAAAKLAHPNIVTVHDFDEIGDNCFIAMEYVEGIDLHRLVKESGPLAVDQACELVRQISLGLQHAHERGLVHRDIKPANLLLTKGHGVQAHGLGTVKILDMGMARLHGAAADSNHGDSDGGLMGTPDYMAPEQALQFHDVDIRADLYSLGCTFYFLLTGRPPFDEFPFMKKMMMHQTAQPRSVRDVQPKVPPDVEQIVHKLLAKKPEERFQTPLELAEVLTMYLERRKSRGGEPDKPAKEPSIKRGFVEPPPSSHQIRDRIGDPRKASGTSASGVMPVPPDVAGRVSTIVPPDSKRQPSPSVEEEKEQDPNVVRWKAKRIALLQAAPGGATAMAFGPNRDMLAAGGLQGALRLWEFKNPPREKIILQTYETQIFSLCFSPDSRFLAWGSGSLDGLVCLGDLTDPTLNTMTLVHGHTAPVDALAFSPDSKTLATGSRDLTVRLWDLTEAEPKERAIFKGHKDQIRTVAMAPDGKTVASAGVDGSVRLWRKGGFWSKDQLAVLQGDWGAVHSVAFAAAGQALAFACQDKTVRIVDLTGDRMQEAAVLRDHQGPVRLALFQPQGSTLVSVCDQGSVILWDLTAGTKLHDWELTPAEGGGLAFTVDGRYLATGNADGLVTVQRLYSRKKS